ISLERVKRARSLKPGAIQVILPDWYPPRMDEIIDYLQTMAKAADIIGLVIYNPPHAKRKLTPEEYNQIKKAGIPIVGCKVAGGDAKWYADMQKLVPELSLFVPGHTLASGFRMGANGSYSNAACLHPGVAQQWYETMLTNMDDALELESRLRTFINDYIVPYILQKEYSSQAVDKLLAAIGGWADIGTRLRWPYHGINNEEVLKLRKECRFLLPEFFPK
ncbi:MAG: dihydrodipicolinate synthase family protein, partial [Chitinophagaceae bacterium]